MKINCASRVAGLCATKLAHPGQQLLHSSHLMHCTWHLAPGMIVRVLISIENVLIFGGTQKKKNAQDARAGFPAT